FFVHMLVTEFLNTDRHLDPGRLFGRPHRMPGDVHQAIRERLEYLGADTVSILSAAAACGDEFDIAILERVTRRPHADLVERLAHPTMTRMILRSPAQPGRYAFAHALVREAVYESLSPTRRARLHRQIAESI